MNPVINFLHNDCGVFWGRQKSCSHGQHAQSTVGKQSGIPKLLRATECLFELHKDVISRTVKKLYVRDVLLGKVFNKI